MQLQRATLQALDDLYPGDSSSDRRELSSQIMHILAVRQGIPIKRWTTSDGAAVMRC